MLRGVRLVIYDMDGTLVDSREAIVETFNLVLEEFGESPQPREVLEAMIGEPLPDMFRKTLPAEKHRLIQACWDAYIPIYARISPAKTTVLPGVKETLSEFKERGVMQALATQKRSEVASRLLGELGLLQYFDLVLGIDSVSRPKPDPEIIHLALGRLGVEPGEAVFVEDTTIGLEAGLRAGVHTVAVTTGTHSREKLASMNPAAVLDNIRELLDLTS